MKNWWEGEPFLSEKICLILGFGSVWVIVAVIFPLFFLLFFFFFCIFSIDISLKEVRSLCTQM